MGSRYTTEIVPKDIAIKLKKEGFPITDCDRYYRAGSNDLTSHPLSEVMEIRDSDIPAPTYGDVIDWFKGKGYIIVLKPFFTYALSDHTAYCIFIYEISDHDMKCIYDEEQSYMKGAFGGSWWNSMNQAIELTISNINL